MSKAHTIDVFPFLSYAFSNKNLTFSYFFQQKPEVLPTIFPKQKFALIANPYIINDQSESHSNYYFIAPMYRSKSMQKLTQECPSFIINILSAPPRVVPSNGRNEELQKAVLGWFDGRGIKKANPEQELSRNRNHLRVNVREKIRKLSAPDETSMLRNRRSKDVLAISL